MLPSPLFTRMMASKRLNGYAKKRWVLRTHTDVANIGFSKTKNKEKSFLVEVTRRFMFTKNLLC